jgi:xanthine dehydrogenase accessory factor
LSFDLAALTAATARHGRVARIVVAAVEGSAPREVGAAMLVWAEGQEGTIGGGALEWEAVARGREMLAQAGPRVGRFGGRGRAGGALSRLDRIPLGPALAQCCGGAVTLLTEVWDAAALTTWDVIARPAPGGPEAMPLAVSRLLAAGRNGSAPVGPALVQGWMVEPVTSASRPLWVWGAGHVGRAVVSVMAPLPNLAITWVDTSPARFPEAIPEGVSPLVAADPAAVVDYAPPEAWHLILTYSHALDLGLCHRLLVHGFGWCGLIGSASKWARFRSRLRHLGHADAAISRICCPIGQKALGKHPQAIAVGVAATLLSLPQKALGARGTG